MRRKGRAGLRMEWTAEAGKTGFRRSCLCRCGGWTSGVAAFH